MNIEEAIEIVKNSIEQNPSLIKEKFLDLNKTLSFYLRQNIEKAECNIIPIQTFDGIQYLMDIKIYTNTSHSNMLPQKTSEEIINIAKQLKLKSFW